jgi:Flp pilus assembly protein TadD
VLRAAVAADPDLPLAWLNLAVSLEQAGRPTEAEAAYREAIRVQPDFRPAHSHLANLLEADGRTGEAAWHRRQ